MSLIDGSNKVFKVQHRGNSMHFDGYKNERDMVERMLYNAGFHDCNYDTANQVAWLESLHKRIEEMILEHTKPDEPRDQY